MPGSTSRSRLARRVLRLAALLVLLPVSASAGDLVVANASVRVPEPYENATAYLVIQNKGNHPRKIVGGTCGGCDWIEIRRAVFKDGMMDSQKLDEMEIPAGGAVAFVPRGLSLSLIGLGTLEAGQTVTIELEFENGEKLTVEAVAKDA